MRWVCLIALAAIGYPVATCAAEPADTVDSRGVARHEVAALLADVPDTRIEVGLLTVAPGPIYWQRFGHNAILLRDRADPARVIAVNYGIFDFTEKSFLLNFVRGRMHYYAVAGDPAPELRDYKAAGRGIEVQWLALAPSQIVRLRAQLERDVSPGHARYRYDYFTRNCSTRVRDALDVAFEGALESSARSRSRGWTYRQHSLRLARPDLPLALGIHFGLAAFTDTPLTLWQEAFVPQRLADAVSELRVDGAPAVARVERVGPHRIGLPDAEPPSWRAEFALAGAALGLMLWLLHRSGLRRIAARRAFAIVRALLLILLGLLGTGLLALWIGTDHLAAHRNLNALIANPLCIPWLLAGAGRGRALRQLTTFSVAGVLLSLALALWFALTGAGRQDFTDWLFLFAPALLVLARVERSRRNGVPTAR